MSATLSLLDTIQTRDNYDKLKADARACYERIRAAGIGIPWNPCITKPCEHCYPATAVGLNGQGFSTQICPQRVLNAGEDIMRRWQRWEAGENGCEEDRR